MILFGDKMNMGVTTILKMKLQQINGLNRTSCLLARHLGEVKMHIMLTGHRGYIGAPV